MAETNINDFLGELNGGVFVQKLAHVLSETALATVVHGNGKKKGKVTVEFSFDQVGENEQVIVSHKLLQSMPTKRGKQSMEDTTDTPMFVGKGGTLSVAPPKENNNGQFALNQQNDGVQKIR
jgi:hypothetical protein